MTKHTIFSRYKLLLLFVPLAFFSVACTSHFEEYNTNQHEATEEMMTHDNLKMGAFFSQMQRNVVLFKDGTNGDADYQIAQGLTSDLYSGYIAATGTWYSGKHNGAYYFISNWIEKTFTSGFASVMPAWQSIVEVAQEQDLPETAALATVIKVEAMHRVADAYGPIPYIHYGSGSLKNNYDALEDVYKKFFTELDSSINVLTRFVQSKPSATILQNYDLIYSGNVTKWVKFANTLRLRLAMRVVYANPTLAQTEAEKSIQNSIGVITDAADRTYLQHSSSLIYHHPLYEIANNFNAGEARMGASMDCYMNGYKDPRLPVYFKKATADGLYHGVRLGMQTSVWTPYVGANISNLNVDESTTPIVWMTAAESYFLRAEGALRGWAMGGTAKDFYNQGVTMSFAENGITGTSVASYLADATDVPVQFTDEGGSNSTSTVPSAIQILWDDAAAFETNLERIITQKWIALYPDGPEGWAEFRRTGYPKLLPVVSNQSSGTVNTDIQVRRIPYPQSEYTNNNAGVLVGVSKLGGLDNGGTKLWWDKK